MDLKSFKITSDNELSSLAKSKNLHDLKSLVSWLKHLDYYRISDKQNLSLVFEEARGTCSSKHAVLKSIIDENGFSDFQLIIGIYKMNPINTPGIKNVLARTRLDYIPEAHCYIRHVSQTIDVTWPTSAYDRIKHDIIKEIKLSAKEVVQNKSDLHKAFIEAWKENKDIDMSTEALWLTREACIEALMDAS